MLSVLTFILYVALAVLALWVWRPWESDAPFAEWADEDPRDAESPNGTLR